MAARDAMNVAETSGSSQSAVELLADSASLAAELPDLLVRANELATTIIVGQHGRRRPGPGEDFWQYRPFVPGESASLIDWRRSAHDDHLFVREHEWEAAHTIWLWVDTSLSMAFTADNSRRTKRARAMILALAIADCLCRGGERVGVPGLLPAGTGRTRPRRLGEALVSAQPAALPSTAGLKRFSDLVILGDFLDAEADTLTTLRTLSATGVRAHLVQVLDPIEEVFPYRGRTEFVDPETGGRLILGRADSLQVAYRERLERLRAEIGDTVRRLNWTFLIHRTDQSSLSLLGPLMARLSDRPELAALGAKERSAW